MTKKPIDKEDDYVCRKCGIYWPMLHNRCKGCGAGCAWVKREKYNGNNP